MTKESTFTNLEELAMFLRGFAGERNWDQYHSPKNLTAALSVEASELLEHFQWKTQEESYNLSPKEQQEVAHEMADVLIYLVRTADRLGIDLLAAAAEKVQLNGIKYPPVENKDS